MFVLEAEWFGRIRTNLFGVRSRQGGASRKCPVDIFSERAGLKYGKVKSISASLFNTDMASKTESKNPRPLCFGYISRSILKLACHNVSPIQYTFEIFRGKMNVADFVN